MRPQLRNIAHRKCRLSPTSSRRFISSNASDGCDIVIVGGGPIGLTLANALGSSREIRKSLRIILVEASDLSHVRDWTPIPGNFSNRVSSLTTASQAFLKAIGVWSHLDESRTFPMEEIEVWDGVSDARVSFSASELASGVPNSSSMALMTENINLQRGLLKHLSHIQDIQILDKTKVASIQKDDREGGHWPTVNLSDGRALRTRLLVGADGFNSPVRSYAGISSYGWSYDAQAIVATFSHIPRSPVQKPNTVAFQRFLPTGPITFLPLSATESSLVWSTKPPLAQALLKSDPAILASMINAAFRLPHVSIQYLHRLILEAHANGSPMTSSQIQEEIRWREKSHAIDSHSAYSSTITAHQAGIPPTDSDFLPPLVTSIQTGSGASFPLRFSHADTYIGEGEGCRTVLVGDAAHTVHPLAGQGLNMGLADVEALVHCIQNAVLNGGDVGSYTALLPYARARYFENHKLMAAIDKLHKIYSSTSEPLVWARSVGVEVLHELDCVKAAIVNVAGARQRSATDSQRWTQVALGVEGLTSGLGAVKQVGDSVISAFHSGLHGILKPGQAKRH